MKSAVWFVFALGGVASLVTALQERDLDDSHNISVFAAQVAFIAVCIVFGVKALKPPAR